jgi:hypothetical protein
MRERGGGRDGREGGEEREVEVPHLLATPSNVLDQTTAGLGIQTSHFIDIIVSYGLPQNLIVNKYSQSSPRLCIYLPSQTADHLESIPIFKQRLETGVYLETRCMAVWPRSLKFSSTHLEAANCRIRGLRDGDFPNGGLFWDRR